MKLQTNYSGAWKSVSTFDIDRLEVAKMAATVLARAADEVGIRVDFRILDATDTAVLMMSRNNRDWHTPAWAIGHKIVP